MKRLYAASAELKPPIRGQSELARALGESPQSVKNWESRPTGISQRAANKVQELLGISATWVLVGNLPMLVCERPSAVSHTGRLDPGMVVDTITTMLIALRRRDKAETLDLTNPRHADWFCDTYAKLERLEATPEHELPAGAVIADLMATPRGEHGTRGEDQQAASHGRKGSTGVGGGRKA